MAEGRLSLDQLGVIAARAGQGSDAHYAQLAECATVNQLRTAVSLEPRPEPAPRPEPGPSITKTCTEDSSCWRIKLPHQDAAVFDAALASHREALVAEWKQDHDTRDGVGASDQRPPLPGTVAAFMRLIQTGWDAEATRRPHGQHTTVVVHLDVEQRAAALHLGPLLSDAARTYLSCDATGEVWFERGGQPIGAGRTTRLINRRLRRALEHRDRACVVPGCGATRGLHAHHIAHWEDGGATELSKVMPLWRSFTAIPSDPRHLDVPLRHCSPWSRAVTAPPSSGGPAAPRHSASRTIEIQRSPRSITHRRRNLRPPIYTRLPTPPRRVNYHQTGQ